jgi:hypothetical protein
MRKEFMMKIKFISIVEMKLLIVDMFLVKYVVHNKKKKPNLLARLFFDTVPVVLNETKNLTYSPCLKTGDSWIQTILAY